MDTTDMNEEEREQRKKEMIEYQTKKKRSTIFMLCASLFEIVITFALMLGLFLLMSFILFRLGDEKSKAIQIAFEVLSVAIFIGSMIGGFFIYKAAAKAVISKFKLKDKLMDDLVALYFKPDAKETEERLRR